tara:strand:+ start:1188 stop:1370 length:183 start_codon:yes stop_codon:yes gene_type:complete
MLEFLQFYTSSFWVWLGMTIGLAWLLNKLVRLIVGSLAALRGTPVHFGDTNIKLGEDYEY